MRACVQVRRGCVLDPRELADSLADAITRADPCSLCVRVCVRVCARVRAPYHCSRSEGAHQRNHNDDIVRAEQGQGVPALACAMDISKMPGTVSAPIRWRESDLYNCHAVANPM